MAAPLAGANYLKLSVEAVKAAVVAWILPFLAIFVPVVILQPLDPLIGVIKIIATLILILFLQVTIAGYFIIQTIPATRSVAGLTALSMFAFIVSTNYLFLALGLICGTAVILWQLRERRSAVSTP